VSLAVGHPLKQQVLRPVLSRRGGRERLGKVGEVPGDDVQLLVRSQHDPVRPVFAPARAIVGAILELLQQRDLVELVVAVRVAHAIEPAVARRALGVHDDIQAVERPQHPLRASDLQIDLLDLRRRVAGARRHAI
jgi:hypothetical protein